MYTCIYIHILRCVYIYIYTYMCILQLYILLGVYNNVYVYRYACTHVYLVTQTIAMRCLFLVVHVFRLACHK